MEIPFKSEISAKNAKASLSMTTTSCKGKCVLRDGTSKKHERLSLKLSKASKIPCNHGSCLARVSSQRQHICDMTNSPPFKIKMFSIMGR